MTDSKNDSHSTDSGSSLVEKAANKMPDLSTGQKVAAGIGLAAAAVAGVAALRAARDRMTGATQMIYHLVPNDEGWKLTIEGSGEAEATFETKEEGLAAGRELAHEKAPSQLVIHRADGTEQDRHKYEA